MSLSPAPLPSESAVSTNSQFALLRHQVPPGLGRPNHWDLLLERQQACWTWALETLPRGLSLESTLQQVDAIRLPDHRKHYLSYQGPISGERGEVAQVLAGHCHWLRAEHAHIEVRLAHPQGEAHLVLNLLEADRWQLRVL